MNPDSFATITCPYCGETNEIMIEPADDPQRYIEDCQVCCRPMQIAVNWGNGEQWLEARRDDD